jgi:hypothetical protein
MRTLIAIAVLIAALGCGSSEQVHVGQEGEKGVVRSDIDRAKETAAKANAARSEADSQVNW